MRPWKNCRELLGLCGIADSLGADRFADLCEMGALLKWSGSPYRLADLERAFMKELAISPLLYWSLQKRVVRPLLDAGGDTLRALGVPVTGEPATVHELAEAVAEALAEGYGPRDPLSDLARLVRDIETRMGVLGL